MEFNLMNLQRQSVAYRIKAGVSWIMVDMALVLIHLCMRGLWILCQATIMAANHAISVHLNRWEVLGEILRLRLLTNQQTKVTHSSLALLAPVHVQTLWLQPTPVLGLGTSAPPSSLYVGATPQEGSSAAATGFGSISSASPPNSLSKGNFDPCGTCSA